MTRTPTRDLAHSNNPNERAEAARRNDITRDVQEHLSHDDNNLVRAWLAANPALDADILQRLAADKDFDVRSCAMVNPHSRREWIEAFLNGDEQQRTMVTRHPNLPLDIALHLARDEDPDIRYELALNANLPDEAKDVLSFDTDDLVTRNLAENHSVWRASTSARFLRNHHPRVLHELTKDCDQEAVKALAASWRGDVTSLKEAAKLVR